MKLVHIVGARPQFIKYAPIARDIDSRDISSERIENYLIHTGQHYDHGMSEIFFSELDIPKPDQNLGVGSGSHAEQTAEILIRAEKIYSSLQPDLAVVYGDTNSTLAGALAASKLNIPVAHVEAGLRSYNRSMPEEINRVLTDHMAELFFCPTQAAVECLQAEGVIQGVHLVGDVMYDSLLYFSSLAETMSSILQDLDLERGKYLLMTLHRAANTDSLMVMQNIFQALENLSDHEIVFPLHPRTKQAIEIFGLKYPERVRFIDPVGYLDMLILEKCAAKILTDSGGVQKEAYLLQVPCITLRNETEWTETVDAGWNLLVGSNPETLVKAVHNFIPESDWVPHYGYGDSAKRIVDILIGHNY